MKKKRLVFKKGISKIIIPFMLDLSPWQEQVKNQLNKEKSRFIKRKNVVWGFEINDFGGSIIVYKSN